MKITQPMREFHGKWPPRRWTWRTSCLTSLYLVIYLAKSKFEVCRMLVFNVHQAKTQLSQLLARVEAGEEVVIARRGVPVARMVGCQPTARRQPDVLKGKVVIPDSFFDPLPDEELDAWEGK